MVEDKVLKNETIINDWVYKPYQLVEMIHNRNGLSDGINTFQIKSINILFQALHNNIEKVEKITDKIGYDWYFIPIQEFLDKLNYENVNVQNIKRDLKSLTSLTSTSIHKNGNFGSFSIIRELKFDLNEGLIYFKVADIVEYMFKNNYIMLEDAEFNHLKNKDGEDSIGYARININSYSRCSKPKQAKSIILYEYLISKRIVIENNNHIKINIDNLRDMLGCSSYKKNSDIIKKLLLPTIEDIEAFSDLEIFYKCELGKYNKITSVSFKVYVKDTSMGNYLHSTPKVDDKATGIYFKRKLESDNVFTFNTIEDMNYFIENKYTNVKNGIVKQSKTFTNLEIEKYNEILKSLLMIKIDKENKIDLINKFFDNTNYKKYMEAMSKVKLEYVTESMFNIGYRYLAD